mmetsp:Transcript_5579/g.12301  ORF Transcript_5579/g.12301 Transcript_5579/m.12301 type:complete len:279 (-) Transcript_5579:19-855(-)
MSERESNRSRGAAKCTNKCIQVAVRCAGCKPSVLRFQTKLHHRKGVEGHGEQYAWLTFGKHDEGSAPDSTEWCPTECLAVFQLLERMTGYAGLRAAMGHMQPSGCQHGGVVGMHFTLDPQRHDQLLRAARAAAGKEFQAEFSPEKLCYWNVLNEWDAALGKRVVRSVAEMRTKPSFVALHVRGAGTSAEEVEVGLFVLVGSLHLQTGSDCAQQSGAHMTLASHWVRTGAMSEPPKWASSLPDEDIDFGACPEVGQKVQASWPGLLAALHELGRCRDVS